MAKWIAAAVGALVFAGLMQLGCQEEMVGAPCVPETDKGEFSSSLSDNSETWSIETRSVQCETRTCLTTTKDNLQNPAATCQDDPTLENCWNGDDGPTQIKYSFCSCRCQDVAGHTVNTNPDKYDYLCECPPDTKCLSILKDIEEAPDMIKGSYCIPNCISGTGDGCYPANGVNRMCVPSTDSEKPWQWKCEEVDLD
jgi:hypothetical protein